VGQKTAVIISAKVVSATSTTDTSPEIKEKTSVANHAKPNEAISRDRGKTS
jgi:hypothetical protein